MAWANGVVGQRSGTSGEQLLISAVRRPNARNRVSVATASGRGRNDCRDNAAQI